MAEDIQLVFSRSSSKRPSSSQTDQFAVTTDLTLTLSLPCFLVRSFSRLSESLLKLSNRILTIITADFTCKKVSATFFDKF